MSSRADPPGTLSGHLQTELLEYAKAPGKYHMALRQPPLLFASIREILQIAADRAPELEAMADEERSALRRAACFFVRTALLSPGADHYTLFGLDRNFDGAALKDRYRLLMRLIHPDFSEAAAVSWPADAAVRVNLAYEVLSSAVQRAEYETRLAAASNIQSTAKAEHRRAQSVVRGARAGMSRSRFKQLVIISSVTGASAVLISLVMSGQEAVHLVQRVRVPPAPARPAAERVVAAVPEAPPPAVVQAEAKAPAEPVLTTPAQRQASPAAAESTLMSQMFTSATSEPPSPARVAVRSPAPAPQRLPLQAAALQSQVRPDTDVAPVLPPAPTPPVPALVPPEPPPAPVAAPVRVSKAEQQPAATPAPAAAEVPPARAPAVARAVPVAASVPRPVPVAAVSLAEAQPLLSNLLQQLESGRGDRVINLLDREARNKPAAQALSREYDGLVDGMRPVRLSHVEFKAEPAEGRLLVTGHIRLQVGEQPIGSLGKKMVLRAEFASREGTVVMTGLSGVPGN